MPAPNVYHVRSSEDGQTLGAALRRWLEGAPWGKVKKLISSRRIMLNGNVCLDDGRRLNEGEVVKILPEPIVLPKEEDVRIVFIDTHVVVVEKPPGVTSVRHPHERSSPKVRRQYQATLDEMVSRIVQKRGAGKPAKQGRGAPRVRPVHRLDRDTSGLMVFARTVPAERSLVQQFRQHTIRRSYLALVHGAVHPQTIATQLVRDRGDGRRGSVEVDNVGKHAVTHVTPLEQIGEYCLIQCRLETGRTHQIRIHLSEIGHTLCGEKVYSGDKASKPRQDKSGARRQALHAAELGFTHPISGQPLHFKSPLPPDMQKMIERLRE